MSGDNNSGNPEEMHQVDTQIKHKHKTSFLNNILVILKAKLQ